MAANHFSTEAVNAIRACLGSKSDDILPELEQALGACPDQNDFEHRIIPQWREHLRQLDTLSNALQTARRQLDVEDPEQRIPWLDDVDRLAQQVDERIGWFERWLDYSGWNKRGRRRNEPRWWLANVVGYILQWHGVPLTKTHAVNGTFHTVLSYVIESLEGQRPDDDNVGDLIAATVDLLRPLTPTQFEAVDFGVVGIMRLWRPKKTLFD